MPEYEQPLVQKIEATITFDGGQEVKIALAYDTDMAWDNTQEWIAATVGIREEIHSALFDADLWVQDYEVSDEYIVDALNERWHVYVEPDLPDGRRAAWPLVVKKGDEYTRTNNGTGRIIRYSNTDEAQRVADQLNGA
jgi:hypothetical protein